LLLSQAIEHPSTHAAELSTHEQSSEYILSEDNLVQTHDTFDTDDTGDHTTMLSEGSSISHFPTFNFSLNSLSSLSSIVHAQNSGSDSVSSKVTLLLGVLEVEGPSYVNVKTGHYAGSEVALLKLIVGDEQAAMCKLIAWRETAELWGGMENEGGLRRGDIVLFESIILSYPSLNRSHKYVSDIMISGSSRRHATFEEPDAKLQITASPNLKSHAQICYRTLPDTYEDRKLRPDLRLGNSVPAVRKVGEVVNWMERMAGISLKP
jgi:Shieldin complex subunit 2, first OB fold domain